MYFPDFHLLSLYFILYYEKSGLSLKRVVSETNEPNLTTETGWMRILYSMRWHNCQSYMPATISEVRIRKHFCGIYRGKWRIMQFLKFCSNLLSQILFESKPHYFYFRLRRFRNISKQYISKEDITEMNIVYLTLLR